MTPPPGAPLRIGAVDPALAAAIWPRGGASAVAVFSAADALAPPVPIEPAALCRLIQQGRFDPAGLLIDPALQEGFAPFPPDVPEAHCHAILTLRAAAQHGCLLAGSPGPAPADPLAAEPAMTAGLRILVAASAELQQRMERGEHAPKLVATRRAVNAAIAHGGIAWAGLRATLRSRGLRPDWLAPARGVPDDRGAGYTDGS